MDNFENVSLIDAEKQDCDNLMQSFNDNTIKLNDLNIANNAKIEIYTDYLNKVSECRQNIVQSQDSIKYRDKIRKDLIRISKLIKSDKDALEFLYVIKIIAQEYCNFYRLPTVKVPDEIGVYKVIGKIVAEISTVIKYLPSNKTIFEKVKEQVPYKWRDEVEAIDRMQKALDYIPKQQSTKNVINNKLLDGIKGIGLYIEICQKEIDENLKEMIHCAKKLDAIKSEINAANKKIKTTNKECQEIKDRLDNPIQNTQ